MDSHSALCEQHHCLNPSRDIWHNPEQKRHESEKFQASCSEFFAPVVFPQRYQDPDASEHLVLYG